MARIAQIISTARYLPEHVVTNAELTARFAALGRPDVINKLAARTGINQRFYSPENWVTSDPALTAAKEALKRAGREPEDVDLIILGTTSPDYVSPSIIYVCSRPMQFRVQRIPMMLCHWRCVGTRQGMLPTQRDSQWDEPPSTSLANAVKAFL